MKKTCPLRSLATLALTFTALALGTSAYAAETLSPCKNDCLAQHQASVEAMLQSHSGMGGSDSIARRDAVLRQIDVLNNCVKSCDLAPAPTPAPAPAPKKRR